MGSSAALITSIVSALLLRLGVITREEFSKSDSDARKLAHNTAQFVHCFAQGKVGSGFDVSSAVFGSQLYTRFNPALLDGLMKGVDVSLWTCMTTADGDLTLRWLYQTASGTLLLSPALSPGDHWDYQTVPIQLPPLVRLVLADVSAGSNTPSLVSKVLKWRREKAEQGTRASLPPLHVTTLTTKFPANKLWAAIDTSNQALATHLRHLSDLYEQHSELYASAVKRMSSAPSSEVRGPVHSVAWAELETGVILVARRCCIRTIRHPGIFGSPKDERGKRTDGYLSLPFIAGTEHACVHATNGPSGG